MITIMTPIKETIYDHFNKITKMTTIRWYWNKFNSFVFLIKKYAIKVLDATIGTDGKRIEFNAKKGAALGKP